MLACCCNCGRASSFTLAVWQGAPNDVRALCPNMLAKYEFNTSHHKKVVYVRNCRYYSEREAASPDLNSTMTDAISHYGPNDVGFCRDAPSQLVIAVPRSPICHLAELQSMADTESEL